MQVTDVMGVQVIVKVRHSLPIHHRDLTMSSSGPDFRVVHVARQGILDARGHVIGYELLYRGGPQRPLRN